MKNKLFKLLALFAVASMIITACGGGKAAAPAEKVKVVIFVGMGTGTDPDQIDRKSVV